MTTPEPELRWYQFSLTLMLLFTTFVAVLCSIGVCTDWSVSAVIAVGGVAGRIVARKWSGLVIGGISGGIGAIIGVVAYSMICALLFRFPVLWEPSWQFIAGMKIAAIIGSLAGGVLGGFTARFRSE